MQAGARLEVIVKRIFVREACFRKFDKKPVTMHMSAKDDSREFFDAASFKLHKDEIRSLSHECDRMRSECL